MRKIFFFFPIFFLVLHSCGSKKITQQKLGDITGQVFAMGTGLPIPDVLVSCSGVADITDSSGSYSLLAVPVGVRAVTASKEGYQPWSASMDVRKGNNTLDIYMNSIAPIDKGIVFYSQSTESPHLFVMDSDGSNREHITWLDCYSYRNSGPLWVSHKTKIAFVAMLSESPPRGIMVINRDGRELDTLDTGSGGCVLWDVSPNPEKLLYDRGSELPHPLYIINVDATGKTMVEPNYCAEGAGFCGDDKVVYAQGGNIYIINTDGTHKEQLSDSVISGQKAYHYYMPVGSPDGSRIAFGVDLGLKCPHYALGIMNSDGSEDTLLAFEVGRNRITEIEFSPVDQKILFLTNDGDNSEIFVINVDGSGLDSLTGGIACGDGGASWSPDGNWIAFTSKKRGNKDIYKVSVDGKILIQLTDDVADDFSPDW